MAVRWGVSARRSCLQGALFEVAGQEALWGALEGFLMILLLKLQLKDDLLLLLSAL